MSEHLASYFFLNWPVLPLPVKYISVIQLFLFSVAPEFVADVKPYPDTHLGSFMGMVPSQLMAWQEASPELLPVLLFKLSIFLCVKVQTIILIWLFNYLPIKNSSRWNLGVLLNLGIPSSTSIDI